jgi:LacI family transcriptional regulator
MGINQKGLNTVTMKDIARELGISTASVSRALSDNYQISEKTKILVRKAAKKRGYRPNRMAQSLKSGNSKLIGIVLPSIENPFFTQVINGIHFIANKKQYDLIITQSHESHALELLNLKNLTYSSLDGLLISLTSETENVDYLKELHHKGLPIVFFDRVSNEIETHQVITDNFKSAYDATLQLIKGGHTRIAHITSPHNVSNYAERLLGYQYALAENGIDGDKQYIKYCRQGGKDLREVETVLLELFALQQPPGAILAASDSITTAVFRILHQLKYHIPGDVALIGFSNTELADILNPSLSTVFQPGFEMGKIACDLLINQIERNRPEKEFKKLILAAEIFLRDSLKR